LASRDLGIRSNSVHPGYITTNMTQSALDDGRVTEIAKLHALKRFGTADEVANVIVFLASEESSFVTGSEYVVDGGYTAH